jgi:diguanylate cyclase (GGDEF)-like protein
MLLPENLSARHAVHRAKYLENSRTRAMGSGMELTARRKNGDEFPVDVTLSYSEGESGPTVIAFMRDITDRKRAEKLWKELAATDPLTGLLNRRELFRRAEMELERARRYKHPIANILLDVDHFKNINDTYGHTAGDSVRVSLAQLLTREIRAVDLAARYGGEEFMLLLPETSLEQACGIAKRICSTVADTPVMVDGQTIRFTISLGVTSSENVGNDFESLLKESDRLLYQAKQSGRNRVVSHY